MAREMYSVLYKHLGEVMDRATGLTSPEGRKEPDNQRLDIALHLISDLARAQKRLISELEPSVLGGGETGE